jgi:hypothetical protein
MDITIFICMYSSSLNFKSYKYLYNFIFLLFLYYRKDYFKI